MGGTGETVQTDTHTPLGLDYEDPRRRDSQVAGVEGQVVVAACIEIHGLEGRGSVVHTLEIHDREDFLGGSGRVVHRRQREFVG